MFLSRKKDNPFKNIFAVKDVPKKKRTASTCNLMLIYIKMLS